MDPLNATALIRTTGGLGLFLLGMIVMTDALRVLAGSSIRASLKRFTRSPVTGVVTGAVSTALLQSSSATTVAAVGFVGAGLIGFSSGLGIVLGANLGTTITGWIVLLVGFKLELMVLMLPCVFFGTLLKLLSSGRRASLGLAIAGFGVIFVGLDQMQLGMSGLQGLLDQLDLPGNTFFGRLQLLGIGALFTILTQSSSAGVAAVLTAIFADAITLAQGLALVIGMDIGTTITAVLATIGGTTGSRRTGYSHFVYNVMTGIMAFALLTPYVRLWEMLAPGQLTANAQMILVAFHTGFNLLGVVLILPFVGHFSRLMLRLIPETERGYTRQLDESLLQEPALAIDAISSVLLEESKALLAAVRNLLANRPLMPDVNLGAMGDAIEETHDFADLVELDAEHDRSRQLINCFHILDHLHRLHERCDEDAQRGRAAGSAPGLSDEHRRVQGAVDEVARSIAEERWADAEESARRSSEECSNRLGRFRSEIIGQVANGSLQVEEASASLESMRWLRRVSHHIARIADHLRRIYDAAPDRQEHR